MDRRFISYIVLGFFSLVSAGMLNAQTYDVNGFNARALVRAQVPTGHEVGKDNGVGEGLHGTGLDCGRCHKPDGKAGHVNFTVGGTIYEDRLGLKPLVGAEVILKDGTGNVISMTTNSVGNFWTFAPVASNPYAVKGSTKLFTDNGGAPATITGDAPAGDSTTWFYKAWIRNPNDGTVRTMVTVAPIGGNTVVNRMGCNMHHNPLGTRTAWVSRKNILSSYPSTGLSYQKHIRPILEAKCAPCHIPGAGMTRQITASDNWTSTDITNLTNTEVTRIEYGNSRDFTSYSGTWDGVIGERGIDYFAVNSPPEYTPDGGAINYTVNPDASPLLCKTKINPGCQVPTATDPTGFDTLPHGGGTFWTEDDADYKAIRQWIIEGALNN